MKQIKIKEKSCPVLKGSPDELKIKLSAPETYNWSQFKQNILEKSINEINLKIEDMDLQMNTGKRGRRVVHVEIYNNFYPIKDYVPTENDVPMFNWLEE